MKDIHYFENTGKIFLGLLFIASGFTIAGGLFFGALLTFWTLGLLVARKIRWEHNSLVYGFLLLMTGMLLTQWIKGGFGETETAFREIYRFLFLFAVFLMFRKHPGDIYFKLFAIFIALHASFAIYQFFTGTQFIFAHTKPYPQIAAGGPPYYALGFFEHHLRLGNIMLLSFPVMLSPVFSRKYSFGWRFFFLLVSAVTFFAAIASLGRSIWLAALVAGGVFLITQPKKLVRIFGQLMLVGLVLSIITFISVSDLDRSLMKDKDKKEITSETPKEETGFLAGIIDRASTLGVASNSERIFMWKAGLRALEDDFFLGIGHRTGLEELRKTYAEVDAENREKYGKKFRTFYRVPREGVHNIYLQIWLDSGLIGLAGYLFLFLAFFITLYWVRKRKQFQEIRFACFLNGITASVAGFLVAGFFENNFYAGEPQTLLFVWMGSGIAIVHVIRSYKKDRL